MKKEAGATEAKKKEAAATEAKTDAKQNKEKVAEEVPVKIEAKEGVVETVVKEENDDDKAKIASLEQQIALLNNQSFPANWVAKSDEIKNEGCRGRQRDKRRNRQQICGDGAAGRQRVAGKTKSGRRRL